jgi:hypothetical protein
VPEAPAPIVLDAGGLIAVERRSAKMLGAIERVAGRGGRFVVPAPVLAQVWRDGARQSLLSRFLKLPIVGVELLSEPLWRSVGELCGITGTADVVDAAVIICARAKTAQVVVTFDPDDLRALDPGLSYLVP